MKEKIRVVCKEGKSLSQEALISKLNPIIRGWANYYRHSVAKEIYGSVDNYTWKCIWNLCISRHNN
ncbi:MAG: group II intron reverse transcriptase/maturase, partial [Candidatus Parabeggiatoa sp. nov. 3]